MFKFNVPKKHFVSDYHTKATTWMLPSKLRDELDKQAKKLGWNSQTALISLILDQFLNNYKDASSLPSYDLKYNKGEEVRTPYRLDPALIDQLNTWSKKNGYKAKHVVTVAIDMFVSQYSK